MTDASFLPVSVVMPVFNDRESSLLLLQDIAKLPGATRWQFCLVDDGSTRNAPELADLKAAGLQGCVLRLLRNVGHQSAIACGLGYASATWPEATVVLIDADGEDQPHDIPKLLGGVDPSTISACVAARRNRSESFSFKAFYVIYKMLFRALTGRIIRFGNFMALSPKAAKRVSVMSETWVHVAASLLASRVPTTMVETDRGTRYAGKSTMNFVALAVHGMRATMVFADVVFMRILIASILVISVAATIPLIALSMKFMGLASPGWLTTVLGATASIMIQVASLAAVSLVLAGVSRSDTPGNVAKRFKEYIATVETT